MPGWLSRYSRGLGWAAVVVSTLLASAWGFWGIVENFHEGWYSRALYENLGLMLVQYLAPCLIFVALALVSLRWPWAGGAAHALIGIAILVFLFHRATFAGFGMITVPLVVLGTLYAVGRPAPRLLAVKLLVGLPLAVIVVAGAWPAYRVSQRIDDGNRGARLVEANGIRLVWAPEGPGWPRDAFGVSWAEASRRARFLTESGTELSDEPQNIWRLPTVEEAVRSFTLHGVAAGGAWDPASRKARYTLRPDKESPLWDPTSPKIYWWTSTEIDADTATIVVYDGGVWPRAKRVRMGSLGFRAVREAAAPGRAGTSHP